MSVGLRAIIIPPRWCESSIHSSRWMKRTAPFRKSPKKGSSFFFRESYPRGKNSSFQLASPRSPSVPPKYIPVRHRSSIEQQVTSDSGSNGWRRGRFVCRKRGSRVFPESFPLLRPGNVRRRRSRLTCCRITGSTPRRVSARELLKFLALSRPSRVIIQPQADRTAKTHESRRNTTVKLKRSKTPWLSWWHCNKIATCSLSAQGLGY